ncbi:cytochrome P450 [Nocardioides sp.]|uniref:cytochrome P450 n=1 Tax=Nocardioides sp. TaxID=35761 RepID=UPI00262E9E5B|nr:cytochrome P450 [Nocardioides sp.]
MFYDPLSYAAYDHPYDVYAQLREQAPVYYNPRRDLWVLSRYAEVKQCLADHQHFVNALGNDMDGTHDSYGPGNLIALDEPHHSVIRDVVQPSFAGRGILALEPHIRELASELLVGLRSRGGGDIAGEVALPIVFDAGLRFLGAPVGESVFWQEHLLRSMARTVGQFGLPDDAAVSNREAEEHIHGVMAARRAELDAGAEPGLDVISQILLAGERGVLDAAEQAGLAHLVLSASTDAPAALVTNCVALLDKFPPLQEYLRANPTKVKAFVQETLRFDTPGTNLCRQTTSDVTMGGVTIPADSRVMVLLGSANRDESIYEHADRFDIHRTIGSENRIMSFGEGIHACMGAPLARLVAQVVVEELVSVLDGVEVRVVGNPERWVKQMVRGFSSLPVRFVPLGQVERTTKPHASTAHLEEVQHLSTRVALATRELETAMKVAGKKVVSEGVVALTLRPLDDEPLPRWEAGAHVDLIIRDVATRQYSLSGDPSNHQTWRLGILRDVNGSGGSLYVHDQLAVGDEVRVRGPRNNFGLVESPRYFFVAGGIGITPILPMIRAAEDAGAAWQLVYGGRARSSMAFLDELEAYGEKVAILPQDETGLLDLQGMLGTPLPDTKVYCCGPEPLLNAVERACESWPKRSLHMERFVAKPLTEPVLKTPFEVHLQRSGLTVTVPPEQSILAAVEQAGVGVRSSCEEGTCGTCEIRVVDGVPDHRDSVLDEEEQESGTCMMICVSRSCTPQLVLDL